MTHQDLTWLTLTSAEAGRLAEFCRAHQSKFVYVCKDEYGAYVGAPSTSPAIPDCAFYFPGCNPHRNPDWQGAADVQFGPDDLFEALPLKAITEVERLGLGGVRFHVTEDTIHTHYFIRTDEQERSERIHARLRKSGMYNH